MCHNSHMIVMAFYIIEIELKGEKTMRKILSAIIIITLLAGLSVPAFAADKATLDAAVNDAAKYMLDTVKSPQVDSVGGEWAVIGLARSGYAVPDSYYEGYYKTVEKYIKDRKGNLHDRKYTEYSRVILGLTAAGYDPRNVAGYDLTAPLEDFEKTIWQGINGPVWALIALDSMNYPNSRRDDYIAEILRRQLNDGGWNLTGGMTDATKNQSSNPDLTGMALQALAKYQYKPEVKAATAKALDRLSKMQEADGGYTGWGDGNIESAVQVLLALCELGIPVNDPRFVKNGKMIIDNVLTYKNADGSYKHMYNGGGNNQMSTEQAFYSLVAAQRAAEGKNSLYSMSDTVKRGEFLPTGPDTPSGAGLPGKHADVSAVPVSSPGKTFPDIQNHKNKPAIEALAERGIITGNNNGNFAPDVTMTRAEFAAIVTRGLALPEKADSPFTDVSASIWYAKPIATAYYYEIVTGTQATSFTPRGTITRQEAAVMVARAAKLCGMDTGRTEAAVRDTLAQFGDYRSVKSWAQPAMAFCYDTGILDGAEFDIKPGEAILRCEIAEMLYRMLDMANLL